MDIFEYHGRLFGTEIKPKNIITETLEPITVRSIPSLGEHLCNCQARAMNREVELGRL